jgi:hypothetical protein
LWSLKKSPLSVEELIARADFGHAYPLGKCALCDRETWSCAHLPGREPVYLCFREHCNSEGLRMALEREATLDANLPSL